MLGCGSGGLWLENSHRVVEQLSKMCLLSPFGWCLWSRGPGKRQPLMRRDPGGRGACELPLFPGGGGSGSRGWGTVNSCSPCRLHPPPQPRCGPQNPFHHHNHQSWASDTLCGDEVSTEPGVRRPGFRFCFCFSFVMRPEPQFLHLDNRVPWVGLSG